MRYRIACLILGFGLCAAGTIAPAAAQPRIHLPEDESPPVLERIGAADGLTALVIAPSGERAAAVLAPPEDSTRSTLLLYSTDAAEPVVLQPGGLVRDLVFAPDSESVLGVLHRPAKKRDGETYLVRVEFAPPRVRRIVRLPPSATSIDLWPSRSTLLVAARNEIRTLTYPALRSGPLYRVEGENLAIAALDRGALVLVGQQDALVLIDLDDPPGEQQRPVRERVETAQAVASLAAAADGSKVLARLSDGTVHDVGFGPLRLGPAGSIGPVGEPGKPPEAFRPGPAAEPREQPSAKVAAPSPAAGEPVTASRPEAERAIAPGAAAGAEPGPAERASPAPPPPVEAEAEPTPAAPPPVDAPAPETPESPEAKALDEPAPEPAGAARAAATETAEPAPAVTRPPAAAPPAHQLQGRVGGPARDRVVAIVLLGPDNLLREALRVAPAEDGSWSADGLEPGRYRVLLDGGGEHVIVSQPPFLLLEIRSGQSIEAGEIQALRAL